MSRIFFQIALLCQTSILALCLGFASATIAQAQPFAAHLPSRQRVDAARIDESQAIRIALHQVSGRVLSVQLIDAIYRIKILTADGRVRTVQVDAVSARVLN